MRDFRDPQYKKWRKAVYVRDGFTCQMPNCGAKKRLNAHHIRRWVDWPNLRYEVANGITLCKGCHDLVTDHEYDYTIMFDNIVAAKKSDMKLTKRSVDSQIRILKMLYGDNNVQDN